MPQLNNLHTRRQAVQPLIIETGVPSSLEPRLERRLPGVLEAELAGACLVEVVDERDVEVCHVGAEAQVDVGEGVGMRAVNGHGAAGHGPLGAVGHGGGLVDVGAWGVC